MGKEKGGNLSQSSRPDVWNEANLSAAQAVVVGDVSQKEQQMDDRLKRIQGNHR